MTGFGVALMILSAGGVIFFLFFVKKKKAQIIHEQEDSTRLPTDTETHPEKKLAVTIANQVVSLLGDHERQVLASVSLHEMTQRSTGSSWSRTGSISKVLILAGSIFIFKMPSRESGKPIWLKAQEIDTLPLKQFYLGDNESPGPGRQFFRKNQSEPIPYKLPRDLTPDVTWEVVDIGTLDVEADGDSNNFCDSDRLYFVTSTEKGGKRRLIYLDARKGEAKGTGGLFLCELFEPSVDVTDIL